MGNSYLKSAVSQNHQLKYLSIIDQVTVAGHCTSL